MKKFLSLLFDRLDHARMGMASAGNRDAGHEIEKQVAVDVFHDHALRLFDDQRINSTVRRRGDLMIALDDGLSFRTGKGCLDERCVHILPVSSLSFPEFPIHISKLETSNETILHYQSAPFAACPNNPRKSTSTR